MRCGSLSASVEPASGRGNAAAARYHCLIRNHPVLGSEVRSGLCPAIPAQDCQPNRCLVSGRGGDHDIEPAALALEGGRPGWLCSRRNRANPPQDQSGQTASTRLLQSRASSPSASSPTSVVRMVLRRNKSCRTSITARTRD